jgi:hypothetical protein
MRQSPASIGVDAGVVDRAPGVVRRSSRDMSSLVWRSASSRKRWSWIASAMSAQETAPAAPAMVRPRHGASTRLAMPGSKRRRSTLMHVPARFRLG